LADLLGEDAGLAEIHKLYRCHDRLLVHKQAVFDHLTGRWRDLFNISYDVLPIAGREGDERWWIMGAFRPLGKNAALRIVEGLAA
jgi:hypothetical protein